MCVKMIVKLSKINVITTVQVPVAVKLNADTPTLHVLMVNIFITTILWISDIYTATIGDGLTNFSHLLE